MDLNNNNRSESKHTGFICALLQRLNNLEIMHVVLKKLDLKLLFLNIPAIETSLKPVYWRITKVSRIYYHYTNSLVFRLDVSKKINILARLEITEKKNSVAWVRERTMPIDDRRLSTKLVPTFADSTFHVVSVTDPYWRILGLLDRMSRDDSISE
jgi:hypothetical protein